MQAAGKEVRTGAGPEAGMFSSGRSLAMLLLLVLIGTLNYIDRVLPAILAEPLKRDIALSDTAIGLINGAGFLIVYGVASIPLARLSDRGRYGEVIVLSVTLWSAMTLLGGLANSAWQLAASRVGVALGEAGGVPAAHAYINRHLPPARRALGLSVFTLCLPLGSIAGFVIGGIAGERLGWRATFMIMGAIGLAIALASQLLLPRPARGPREEGVRTERRASLGALFRKRSLVITLAGSGLIAMGGYTGLTFTPAFLMRAHGLTLSQAGLWFGLVGGGAAVVILLVMGWASDRLARRDPRWILGTVIVAIAAGLPLSIHGYMTGSLGWAMAGIALNHGIVIAQNAPVFAALHRLAPLELRAQASALLLLFGAVLGGLGPLAAGATSDGLGESFGPAALSWAMLVIPATYALGAICYALALRSFREELPITAANPRASDSHRRTWLSCRRAARRSAPVRTSSPAPRRDREGAAAWLRPGPDHAPGSAVWGKDLQGMVDDVASE